MQTISDLSYGLLNSVYEDAVEEFMHNYETWMQFGDNPKEGIVKRFKYLRAIGYDCNFRFWTVVVRMDGCQSRIKQLKDYLIEGGLQEDLLEY